MSLNCQEINAVLSELNIDGYFIQDIIQPGYDTLALYLYANSTPKTLLICTAQNSCRLHETRRKINKNDKPLRFMEFLKSKVKGARIESCYQIGLLRIVQMNLVHGDENFTLYIRLWSNASNVILCDKENKILDSMFRRPGKDEVSGGIFKLPEEQIQQKIWPVRDFAEAQQEYKEKFPKAPPMTFNQKVDYWYGEHAQSLSIQALLAQTEKWYNQSRSQMENALEKLLSKRNDFENAQNYKHQGDLIMSYSHLLDGTSKYLQCEDYETALLFESRWIQHFQPTKTLQPTISNTKKQYQVQVH